ncbi:PepSY domain-containing protein [Runella sp.]|uniref:PepSY domain-containing protein n=1 Tax=Runella sp. TaxID=1960881 RepID=UPI002632F2F0|nr:PepSY domain-containing protein [Runella sp.]
MKPKSSNLAVSTRLYRKLHKWVAIPLLLFFLLIGVTGLLLGWKKQIGLLPSTKKGELAPSAQWISLDSIQHIAQDYAQTKGESPEIDRIDVRPQKGVAKIVFVNHFTELQIDCTNGKIVSESRRNSDIIEKVHDGSIIDFLVKTENDPIKLVYTSLLGIGLILLTISGSFLWYNPIRMRKSKI